MNEQQNINFVLEVEKYPCLYNSNLSGYYRRSETDKAWEEIGKVMNMTAIACKEKWRNLRVVFMRHVKISKNGRGIKKPYYLLDVMQFLTPFVKQTVPLIKSSTSSNDGTDNIDDVTHSQEPTDIHENEFVSENTEGNNEPCSPKRKKVAIQEAERHYMDYSANRSFASNECQISSNHVTSFLDSLAPELKEMNLQQFKIFKRRALALIDEIMDSCGTTSTAACHQSTTASDIAIKSKKIFITNDLDTSIGIGSPENISNCTSPSLFVEADSIKTEFET